LGFWTLYFFFYNLLVFFRSRGSVVGMASGYGLDD
jgi:hypothetical protein